MRPDFCRMCTRSDIKFLSGFGLGVFQAAFDGLGEAVGSGRWNGERMIKRSGLIEWMEQR